jgi:hypothetical protein
LSSPHAASMASPFPLNMCITMEPPVRYDTYHAVGVPPFIVDFRTVNNPSVSSDSRIRRVDQRPPALARGAPRRAPNRLEAVDFARQMRLAQREDRRPRPRCRSRTNPPAACSTAPRKQCDLDQAHNGASLNGQVHRRGGRKAAICVD